VGFLRATRHASGQHHQGIQQARRLPPSGQFLGQPNMYAPHRGGSCGRQGRSLGAKQGDGCRNAASNEIGRRREQMPGRLANLVRSRSGGTKLPEMSGRAKNCNKV
jgi:hypothetical protein